MLTYDLRLSTKTSEQNEDTDIETVSVFEILGIGVTILEHWFKQIKSIFMIPIYYLENLQIFNYFSMVVKYIHTWRLKKINLPKLAGKC